MSITRRFAAVALAVVISPAAAVLTLGAAQDCKDAASCRQLAVEAKERKDFDAFHNLAWKAMSLGPKNEPAAMTLLARAQSMSGRPLDALVMLQRLASMGVITDVATSDDFERVRALPSWGELEGKLTGKPTSEPASPAANTETPKPPTKNPPPTKTEKPVVSPTEKPAATEKPSASEKPSVSSKPISDKPAAPEKPTVPDKPAALDPVTPTPPTNAKVDEPATPPAKTTKPGKGAGPAEPLKFSAAGVNAVGLAYDGVSGRFIIGDRTDRRLLVLGERSGRLASLAGVDAGFDEVTAFEIDTREGDLWVVSAASGTRSSTVHKLQLISGRMLSSIALPADQAPARFTDVAVTAQSILILDSDGRRIFRAAKKGRTLDLAMRFAVPGATVMAPASETAVYVAYDRGLLRADLTTRSMSVVEPAAKVDIAGIVWMRAFRGSLIAIQQPSPGASRVVRIRLDEAGRTARAVDVLEENAALAGLTSAALTENALYYLNRASDSGDVIVRTIPLK
jgi:hypothetical protein